VVLQRDVLGIERQATRANFDVRWWVFEPSRFSACLLAYNNERSRCQEQEKGKTHRRRTVNVRRRLRRFRLPKRVAAQAVVWRD